MLVSGGRKEDQKFESSVGYTFFFKNVLNRLGCSSAVKGLSRICKALYLISNTTKKNVNSFCSCKLYASLLMYSVVTCND